MSDESDIHLTYLGAAPELLITTRDKYGDGLDGVAWAVAVVSLNTRHDPGDFTPCTDVTPDGADRVVLRVPYTPTARGDEDVYVRGTRGARIDITHAGIVTTR